jgi:hypothetical protein
MMDRAGKNDRIAQCSDGTTYGSLYDFPTPPCMTMSAMIWHLPVLPHRGSPKSHLSPSSRPSVVLAWRSPLPPLPLPLPTPGDNRRLPRSVRH